MGGLSEPKDGEARGHLEWIENQICAVGDAISIRVIELGPDEGDSPKFEVLPADIVKRMFPRPSLLTRVVGWVSNRGRRDAINRSVDADAQRCSQPLPPQ